ncbi:hypothetical protein KP001_03060 [Geomonas subterranea]|uniref:AMP-binding enzyme C-terminal domain-containing protein n=1 Tax=Geomonas subterranea TaxID=2847989 RepID=A0ABX8LJK6_9BACT|nr:hypothetical protein KP001_03060 [Geomonas subterranea]QXM10370.1 hypothetical protein KP002_04435 [Geomonas subterranea]
MERALLELEEVAESGGLGRRTRFYARRWWHSSNLHGRFSPAPALELKLRLHVSKQVSRIAAPQEIILTDSIPKNKSGKIMCRVLKAPLSGATQATFRQWRSGHDHHRTGKRGFPQRL